MSQSGSVGLVGAWRDDDNGSSSGSAYLFRNLNTASGTVTEDVKLLASEGAAGDQFGYSVSLDGDQFVIGAQSAGTAGQAYSGSVSSVTTLNEGNASRTIDGISFISRTDWIIGETTDDNEVTLTAGDSADVIEAGMGVYIGKDFGADDNRLIIEGEFIATIVEVGSLTGNTGNTLEIGSGATLDLDTVRLVEDNFLSLEGDFTLFADLETLFGAGTLETWDGIDWLTVDSSNESTYLSSTFDSGTGYTTVTAVPEPETYAAISGLLGLGLALIRRRRRGALGTRHNF